MFDRTGQSGRGTRKTSAERIYPAPRGGWVRNDNLSDPKNETAAVLRNGFPTVEGVRIRRGSANHATVDAAVTHLAQYNSGPVKEVFATTVDSIFNVTAPADPEVAEAADVTSLTSGDWSHVQFTAGGGLYLVMVNGADAMQQYDGAAWAAITGTITGVTTADLSHVWTFKKRLFFVEGGTMSAWYLGTLAVAGAATEFPLGNIFKRGGALLFGATWSVDAGDGMDDTCIFVTTEGEIAVYQGNDPGDVNDWSLVGVYDIGIPLHKNAHFRGGGDVAILTRDGIIPVSAAMKSDKATFSAQSVSYPIETAWFEAIAQRDGGSVPFSCCIWPTETLLMIGLPSSGSAEKLAYVANARTGKWAEYTGWDIRSLIVFDDELYFGTGLGKVVKAETGGSDNGSNYVMTVLGRFDNMKSANIKQALHARAIIRTNNTFAYEMFANSDFNVSIPSPPSETTDASGDVWGTGIWGTSVWAEETTSKAASMEWQTVAAVGESIATGIQVTCGRDAAPDLELVSLTLQYQNGQVF